MIAGALALSAAQAPLQPPDPQINCEHLPRQPFVDKSGYQHYRAMKLLIGTSKFGISHMIPRLRIAPGASPGFIRDLYKETPAVAECPARDPFRTPHRKREDAPAHQKQSRATP